MNRKLLFFFPAVVFITLPLLDFTGKNARTSASSATHTQVVNFQTEDELVSGIGRLSAGARRANEGGTPAQRLKGPNGFHSDLQSSTTIDAAPFCGFCCA